MGQPRLVDSYGVSNVYGELKGLARLCYWSPGSAAKEMVDLLERDPEAFCHAAARMFAAVEESEASRFVLKLLLARGLALRVLIDPHLNFDQVLAITRAVVDADPNADLSLAKAVADAARENPAGSVHGLVRILQALDQIADVNRIAPRLLTLLRHPDARLRSKTALIVGRCGKSVPWVTRQMRDGDARTRANAIEALWGLGTEETRNLLRSAAADENNRVAGNALVGLYRAGDCWAISELLRKAASERADSRATAAWTMGALGDLRFKGVLGRMTEDKDPKVRRHAARSLEAIEAKARSLPRAPWRMAAISQWEPGEPATRAIHLAIRGADGNDPRGLLPTEFAVLEGAEIVTDYRIEERCLPQTMAFAFVFPYQASPDDGADFAQAVRRGLQWKRPRDLWAAVSFQPPRKWRLRATLMGEIIEIAPPDLTPQETALPDFTPAMDSPAGAMEGAPATQPAILWDALLGAVTGCKRLAPLEAAPLVVVYCPYEAEAPLDKHVAKLAMLDRSVRIDVITESENPKLEELCRLTDGAFYRSASRHESVEKVERLSIANLSQYTIAYHSNRPAAEPQIRVVAPEGWVES